MCPRTSITCMWKKGFIGDIVPTENSTAFYYKIRSQRREECARLHDNIYSVVSRSPVSVVHLLEISHRIFFHFEKRNVVSCYMHAFCLHTIYVYMYMRHDASTIYFSKDVCRFLFILFVLFSSSLRMKNLFLSCIGLQKEENATYSLRLRLSTSLIIFLWEMYSTIINQFPSQPKWRSSFELRVINS